MDQRSVNGPSGLVHAGDVAADRLAARLGRWTHAGGTLSSNLSRGIAALIGGGELRPGDRLPAERALAAATSVSRGTVVAAYADLAESGLVERRQGSGTRVAGGAASGIAPVTRPGRGEALFSALPNAIDLLRTVPQIPELAVRLIREHTPRLDLALLPETDPAGLPVLRAQIAELFQAEGTPTTPEQILVTHGAQQAISLVVNALVGPGDVVLAEEVTWPGVTDSVGLRGGTVHGIPMTSEGLDVDALEQALARLRPALVALNPHHQNPTGTRLPPAARHRVAELSAQYGVPVIEDRVVAGISFDGVVPPSLAAERADAPIIVVESVSKWAWAGLRIGWLRADPVLVRRLRGARQLADQSTSVPAQLLALDLLAHADELRRENSRIHHERLRLLQSLMAEHLPDWTAVPPRGGLSLWAGLPIGSANSLARVAATHGVSVAGSAEFAASVSPDDHIRIPFTAPDDVLAEAIRRLGEAWREYRETLSGTL
ncbi:PLP-dependent aminotransferase family protein [Microbacterium hydrocarbonoxydans]|uniref:aminotransferase-like domain-containing protein n=1 Tax=Microbacterium hydrocarbonoxydans TaxID=273678 RepID=UPI0007BAF522|nr:PLP-dependent aminotransferase family protein [Microbacterium hydrocarbonoxydans]GAT71574.1 MocR family transcriptional regulator [Microbacterium sp. HM58-2]